MNTSQEIRSYRDLRLWQAGMSLAEACYHATGAFPRDELFGMTSQIRRAAASIPANVAEGHGRAQPKSFIQFLRVAQGSLKELETHLLLAERVGHLGRQDVEPLLGKCEEIGKMIRALINSLSAKSG